MVISYNVIIILERDVFWIFSRDNYNFKQSYIIKYIHNQCKSVLIYFRKIMYDLKKNIKYCLCKKYRNDIRIFLYKN